MVFGVVDAVVMHEHECRTVNSWSATVEAVERMAHEHAKQRDTITHTPQYQRPQPPVVGTLGDEVRKRFIQSKVGSAIKLDENTP